MPSSKPASPAGPGLALGVARSMAGWLVLLIYLGAYSPLGFGVAALVGSFDPNHQVRVCAGEQGLQLVLHHGSNCAGHRHGAVAGVLTFFAQSASAADPDHVLQFGKAESFTQKAQITAPSPTTLGQPVFAFVETTFWFQHEPLPSSVLPHPPPAEGGRLVGLRSTLLLI